MRQRRSAVWKGLVSGAAAGLVGKAVMAQALRGLTSATGAARDPATSLDLLDAEASAGAYGLTARALPWLDGARGEEGTRAGYYATGLTTGALYGALAERRPRVTAGAGTGFGLAVLVGLDEVLAPALGLTAPPWRHGWRTHAAAAAGHVVLGITTELTRRGLRRLLA